MSSPLISYDAGYYTPPFLSLTAENWNHRYSLQAKLVLQPEQNLRTQFLVLTVRSFLSAGEFALYR